MIYLLSIIISLLFGGLAYAISSHLYIGIGIFLLYSIVFIVVFAPMLKKFQAKERKRHECYRFVNGFIVSLSVSGSLDDAYQSATLGAVDEEESLLKAISNLSVNERIDYLASYFVEPYYRMFLSIISLYLDQGGDLLDLAEPLIKEVGHNEIFKDEIHDVKIRYLGQFISLWFMSALVLLFVRIGLNGFYDSLSKSLPYLLTSVAYFLIAIASFAYFIFLFSEEKPFSKGKERMKIGKKK
ncbi:MAG: hypothetical protein LKF75_03000 [Bacilli bacterium]|jgi:hypothetical protein|nr:hypothetical protein [Bacilli bacterium]MCH4210636.1 hypothetical protein [Bacilli bacterium]MCH4228652.1 hypothetical protein [Bacilli bacterium]MCI2055084.1 hypothetical protein [Bacilli bacterium]